MEGQDEVVEADRKRGVKVDEDEDVWVGKDRRGRRADRSVDGRDIL